ncbi:hypothetical protein, conserved [Thermococcus onnurineus NA1]|uniref:DUF2226 domain-containing protein n=1 Tax=Thermococcus onnurineus (strain NA1) TaxID=523850 RepID=B6YUK4_THEON|nr:hypothetical protein [Thermococcus onnurineus]ACJ16040.1 hypothetical protein, conserved [Thermococcus onnurineus NA1]
MQLPNKQPIMENMVVTSAGELGDLIKKALSEGNGAFLKIFAKDASGKYYMTILFDRSKILAAECLLIDKKQSLIGEEAISVLKSFLGKPMVVDVYTLDELEIKLSIADNVDVYAQTPKIPLNELFGKVKEGPPGKTEEKKETAAIATAESVPAPKLALAGGVKEKPPVIIKEETKPAPAGKPEVIINFTGGTLPKKAFQIYAEDLLKDAKRIKGLRISRIEFDANVGEGIVYLNVHIYGSSAGSARDIEIAEKRMLHAVSKYAPVLLREAEVKPIIRDVSIVIDGQEVKPQEIVDKDKKKTANVTKDGKISLSALEDVWPYFSAYARTVITEIESAGIKVTKAYFDVKGRREFEINLSMVAETGTSKDAVERIVNDVLTRHARELSRSINRYITVHNIDVEIIAPAITPKAATGATAVATSGKAAEVLAKKKLLEKEVEQLLKQAGIDELAVLTEEKKKEAEETMLKGRIEPAVETLKSRIHTELKLVPRVTFKWLKMNHEVKGSTVYVDIEASFLRENVGGLFGSFSGVSDEKIRQDIAETVNRIIKEVSREYGIGMALRRLNVIIR